MVRTFSPGAILVTEGADTDSIAAFKKIHRQALRVFSMDEKVAAKYGAEFIPDVHDLVEQGFDTLHIFGYGLKTAEIENQPIAFHPSPLPTGVTNIYWNRQLLLGEKLTVQGIIHNASSQPAKIILSGYENLLDSITVPSSGDHSFSLAALPEQMGRMVYDLVVVIKKDTVVKEPVPVETFAATPVKTLLLSSSPDFENKFLQNWLAEKGYPVVTRTAISRNKTTKAFLNTKTESIDRLNAGLLNRFDIIIADAGELASLTNDELQLLKTAIGKDGKGLVVRADSLLPAKLFFASSFPLAPADTNLQREIPLYIAGDTTERPLTTPASFYIREQNGTIALVKDKQGHVFTGRTIYGAGNIITTTLQNSFGWALSGKKESYDNLWSEIVGGATRSFLPGEIWQTTPYLPRVNEKTILALEADSGYHPSAQIKNTTVYLSEHPGLSFRFNGVYWPRQEGWQTGYRLNGTPYYWFVFGSENWKTVAAAEKERATTLLSLSKTKAAVAGAPGGLTEKTMARNNVSKFLLWFLFLVACGYLWFENKYYNS